MPRVAVTFTFLALVYPVVAFVAGGEIGIAGPLTVALLGLLFWLLALWRNNRLVRRPADARGDGTGQWVAT